MPSYENGLKAIVQVAADLRDPEGGCPWDLEQTHTSLVKHLIEEAYETVDAITALDEENPETVQNLKEELGDLLFQVVIHARLADEKNWFNLDDVARFISEKLVFRHPHVYGSAMDVSSSEEVLINWEKLKQKERNKKNKADHSVLDGIPSQLPALLKAYRSGEKASKLNFDWPAGSNSAIKEKVSEELHELLAELPDSVDELNNNQALKQRAEEELGDLFFALSQLARKYEIDPEQAAQKASAKFKRRFTAMESQIKERLIKGDLPELAEWEELWQHVKKQK